jgi:hypothetical protein
MSKGSPSNGGPIYNPKGLGEFINGMRVPNYVQHMGDMHMKTKGSFLNVPSNMPDDNPFKSDKQRKFLYSQKPEVAKKFAMHSKKK